MARTAKLRKILICPICLKQAFFCPAFKLLLEKHSLQIEIDPGATVKLLSGRHATVCDKCKETAKKCWARNGRPQDCVEKTVAANETVPDWWRAGLDELHAKAKGASA